MQRETKEEYIVKEKIAEASGVSSLMLTLAGGGIPPFTAGQFLTVYFPDSGTVEGKAYSISSAPHDPTLSITVRAIGEFSNRLCALRQNDVITASLPYGYFSSEEHDARLVLVAAGIGIAPMRSIMRDSMKKNPERRIDLFYTNRTVDHILFKDEFDALQKINPHVVVHHFITRGGEVPEGMTARRMQAEDVLTSVAGADHAEFLVCGAISFVRDLWRGLHESGVSENAIYTEAFFSR